MITVGFIGLGVMGRSMAAHILQGGYPLLVYTRTKAKAQPLLEQGARWCETVSELARQADVVITIVGYPADVEEVYLDSGGILENIKPGGICIDMTTSSPQLAKRIYEQARLKGIHVLDAPVSGGDIGAREARLAIMVGGDDEPFAQVLPIFKLMGNNIVLQGPSGSGQYTKMANQIAIASTMMGVAEALAYAKRAGLDQERVLKTIETGAAGSFSLSKLGPRMISGDLAPGFYVKHFVKDMKIAIESAQELGLNTPGLALAKQLYEQLADQGHQDSGTQALYNLYE